MVKGDFLLQLIQKFYEDDFVGANRIINTIIEYEQEKNHYKFAQELLELCENYHFKKNKQPKLEEVVSSIPFDRDRNLRLFDMKWSKKSFNEIILSIEIEKQIRKLLKEWKFRNRLANYQINPTKNVLLYGPPGCGKTLCAHVIANELDLPLIIIRTEAIISSLLGETAVNLKKIFDTIGERRPAVVFFDEFDALAKSRIDDQEHGEMRRAVAILLQIIENVDPNILILTATNHPETLDKATWRRFDLLIKFSKPNDIQIINLIELNLKNFPHEKVLNEDIKSFQGLSHADVERACFETLKYAILNNLKKVTKNQIIKFIKDEILRKKQIDRIFC